MTQFDGVPTISRPRLSLGASPVSEARDGDPAGSPAAIDRTSHGGAERWRWYLLVLEALVWSAAASLAIRTVPFRILAARLGPMRGTASAPTDFSGADRHRAAAVRPIGRAVERAAQRMPWPVRCLPQAMAAKGMLAVRGIPSRLHLGVAPASARTGMAAEKTAKMTAHAWLTCGDTMVVGGEARPGFTELARFG
ncbi:Transglutaminase-like superfamily protein [Methylobacterium sp. 174MFSha1.1]|uniref:lasso peptide biosynthesis B2 protein n=1 Tax=Methylobacterium sp. 174MFSha1.1 TaxID=1502749 RepID=UPI0008E321EC|nr:lasso peptide biosynthesis B2 protein [Methylobacterium sp. 174MFSha1.1]SFU47028.1 Transglutaminase-like superfamily protein [Methylobacterium sp. 174MFSha1.1]